LIPIPILLLPDTAQYFEIVRDSRYESFKDPVTIKNVRIDYSKGIKKNATNQDVLIKGKLIIDCTNSNPVIEVKTGSKIVVNGINYFVGNVDIIRAIRIHHYEVELT
jgi:hypothetical protein